MKVILLLIKSSKLLFFVAAIASILTGLFSTLVIKDIHSAIQGNAFDLDSFLIDFFVAWALYGVCSLISSYSVALLTQVIIHELRVKLSNKILRSEFSSLEQNQQKILPILTEDIKTIAYSIDRLPGVTTGLATVIGILIYMIWYSPLLSLATIFLFAIVFVFSRIALPYVRKYADHARDYLNDLFDQFQALIFGIKELYLNRDSQIKLIDEVIIPTSKKQNNFYLKENVAAAIINRSTDMILLAGMAALIVIVFKTGFVTLDFLGEYITLILFTLAPLSTATSFLSNLKRMEVALNQIDMMGLELDKVSQKDEGLEPLVKEGDVLIKLDKIEHSYYHSDADQHFSMGPIDLSVNYGEILFIVGGNGSGKTTLAKLLLGLYKPLSGEIFYYEQKVSAQNIFSYRSQFGAVFTDSFLFQKFLDVDESYLAEKGDSLLKLFRLENKVKIQDHGFSSNRLSEGQKKRLALIISILENKDIYLFDEWAANQDPLFKEIFYKDIIPMLKSMGKTLIVISHDDRYFNVADRIIKLVNGKIEQYVQ